jgi:hypothetical protein
MAKQFTGIDGALYADGNKVARVSDWSISASAESLETTSLGDFARTYIYGRQGFSGSCTLYYYEDDAGKINGAALLSDTLRTTQTPTEPTHTMELRFDGGASTRRLSFKVLLQDVQISASVGGVIQAQVSFTVTGALTAASFV